MATPGVGEPAGTRVLVSGSRLAGATARQRAQVAQVVRQALCEVTENRPGPYTLVHGDAHGVDLIADAVARHMGWTLEPHPADWARYRRAAGPTRNRQMVEAGADVALFFPYGQSKGTRGCLELWTHRYPATARRRVIELDTVILPVGRHRKEEAGNDR